MRPFAAPSSLSRSSVLRQLLVLHSTMLLPLAPTPPASAAADLDVAIALTPLLQLRTAVADVDGELFADLLLQPARVTSAGGIEVEAGSVMRGTVRKILQQGRPRDAGKFLAEIGRRSGQLNSARATEVENRSREAQERLAAVLEYERTNSFKTDALGNREPFMRPEELTFVHRALVSAREELEAACSLFPTEERTQAAVFLTQLNSKEPGGSTLPNSDESGAPSSRSGGGGVGAGASADVALRARDAAIATAIAELPSPVGTALTRSDLQAALDNAYREANADAARKTPRALPAPQEAPR